MYHTLKPLIHYFQILNTKQHGFFNKFEISSQQSPANGGHKN